MEPGTSHFGRVKASFGLNILMLVCVWAVSQGAKPETGHFGRAKGSFGLNILFLV